MTNLKNPSDETIHRLRILSCHLLFWILYVLFNALMYGMQNKEFFLQLQYFTWYLPVVMAATYLTAYVLVPRFLFQKKFLLFFITMIGSALVFAALQRFNVFYIMARFYHFEYAKQYAFFTWGLVFRILQIYATVAFASALKLGFDWYHTSHRLSEVRQQQLEAELKNLKTQLHPHFLFNTLNNLYALTLKKSPEAPKALLQLSGLLDTILRNSDAEFVSLESEIKLLNDYVALEQLRYGQELKFSFHQPTQIEGVVIAPWTLLPLVENAFKHSRPGQDRFIRIELSLALKESEIIFCVKNTISPPEGVQSTVEGTGLTNLRKRLSLIYRDHYDLGTHTGGGWFTADIIIRTMHEDPMSHRR